jgi:hypothetical protein
MRQQIPLQYVPEGSPARDTMPTVAHPGTNPLPQRTPSLPPPPFPHYLQRDFGTPDIVGASPYAPSPGYGPQRPTSTSTFSHAPLNLPGTLQQINTSLQALHERLTALERSQAMLLRKEERRRSWFFSSSDADELDDAELEAERDRWAYHNPNSTTIRLRKKKALPMRFLWAMITALRRAVLGVGATVLVGSIVIALLSGGWRRQFNDVWRKLRLRIVRSLADA